MLINIFRTEHTQIVIKYKP